MGGAELAMFSGQYREIASKSEERRMSKAASCPKNVGMRAASITEEPEINEYQFTEKVFDNIVDLFQKRL